MNQFAEAIAEATQKSGSQKMRVTFKSEAWDDVLTLLQMDGGSHIINMTTGNFLALVYDRREKSWNRLVDRTVTITMDFLFNATKFESFANGAFESVEAVAA